MLVVDTLAGTEIERGVPSRFEALAESLSPTSDCLCAQDQLEPLFVAALHAHHADLRFGTELVSCAQTTTGVTATTVERASGTLRTVQAAYMIAADGGHSTLRYLLGIPIQERAEPFRVRLVEGRGEALLFEKLLAHAKEQGWLKAKGRQRTDSTHVLAAIQTLGRLECVAETLRQALNMLSAAIPEWVQTHIHPEWFERYATRWQDYRLPSGRQERQDLAEMVGQDGRHLYTLLQETAGLEWTRYAPAVETLRQVWVQQFYVDEEATTRWREAKDLPPSSLLICTPYDPEARFSQKRSTTNICC